MIFVSGAPVVLKKKVSIAWQRMFLFADNVEPPHSNTAMFDVLTKINASRGFCAKVNADLSMSCVRSAGWRNNYLYYNYVPSLGVPTNSIETSNATSTQTIFDVFGKYYSIGRLRGGTWLTVFSSLLENIDDSRPTSPLEKVMILPPCDDTALSALSTPLVTYPSLSLSYTRNWNTTTSLGIVTGRHEETTTTLAEHIQVTELNAALDRATITRTISTQSGAIYDTSPQTVGPRTMTMFTKVYTVTRSPYSDSVIGSGTTYSNGPYRSSATDDASLIYGIGNKANTANYPLVWGMMPIVGQTPNDPMYAVILKAEEDFEQTGLATPGTKPVMQMKQLPELEMSRKYLM